MEIEMILSEIGERSHFESKSIYAAERERVARYFHHQIRATALQHPVSKT